MRMTPYRDHLTDLLLQIDAAKDRGTRRTHRLVPTEKVALRLAKRFSKHPFESSCGPFSTEWRVDVSW